MEKFRKVFVSYNAFTDHEYTIADINFDLQGENGMGYAEGYVKYNAILESGETVNIRGLLNYIFRTNMAGGVFSI